MGYHRFIERSVLINVRVEIPHEPAPMRPSTLAADIQAAVFGELRKSHEAYPINELWVVVLHTGQNHFTLRDPANKKRMKRVPADDPRAWSYLVADDVVVVGFRDRNRGRPHIKGRSVGRSPSRNSTILFWSQSESCHLRNNCAVEAARVFAFTAAGSAIYTYTSKTGGSHDSRARAYGLATFRENGTPRLAVAYPRFGSGDNLEAYRMDILNPDGSLVRYTEWATTTADPLGNPASNQQFLDPSNLHLWINPQYTTEQLRLRAWHDGSPHKVSSAGRNNDFVSCAFNSVLYPAFIASYTGGANSSGSPPPYWPPTISALAYTGGNIQGLVRDESEGLVSWTLNPTSLATLPKSIISSCSGSGTGWPGSPDGTTWTIAVSERALLDGMVAANAALGHGYAKRKHFTGSEIQYDTKLHDYTHKLRLNIAEIDSATGRPVWQKSITIEPTTPIVPEGLLTPFESYLASPFGTGPGDIGYGPVIVEGRVAENSLSDKTPTDGFGYAFPLVYPGRLIESGVTLQGVEFSWPQFQYFRAANIRLFPHRSNDVLPIPPSSESSDFYSGCKNNLATFTQFGLTTEDQSSPCGPGIFRDTTGNIYFSYMFPRGFLMQGKSYYRSDIVDSHIQYYVKHLPFVNWGWESRQVSLDKNGVLRWERDLTQWLSDAEWWGHTGADFGFDFVVGGPSGEPLPLSDNLPWQIPVGDGKFLITLREYHGIGSSYRPDMYLEVQDGSTGAVLQSQYLPEYFDTVAFDTYDGPTLIAVAGERIWYVSDVKVKAGVSSTGVAWAIIYMRHSTRDNSSASYDQIYTIQAPSDGSIAAWSGVGLWNPGAHEAPTGADWESVALSDGAIYWNHWDGSAWKIYKKTL